MRRLPCVALLLLLVSSHYGNCQDTIQPVVGTTNNQIRIVNTYPEYWVDGKPFIEHASAFFYHRIPRDRWASLLMQLRDMGINTIDVYPFWNWHQPEEGIVDLTGQTNPRRDLQYLLRTIQVLGLKATLRPGPYFTSEWYNGGYPDWLLRRAEYGMSEQSILEGRYPRLSALQYDKSEEAADGYLQNATHLKYTRQWYKDVLTLSEPFLADRGGPILSIQIDDDQAIGRENYNGPQFWKYMETLRTYLKEFTHDAKVPYYINGADMRVNPAANYSSSEPIWNTGQDYQMTGEGGYSSIYEAAKNKFLTEIVKTEPLSPPGIIEFQAGWFIDEKNTYARATSPTNTLMASRVMFQNGMKVLNYYPLNDTLYPAGYECQWANWFYGWETAVNFAGEETGRARFVRRNGRLMAGMGSLLGATHLLPDAAVVHPMAAFPQSDLSTDETRWIANWSGRIVWSGVFDHFNFELIDSDHSPQANFQRYRVVLLPNPASGEEELGKKLPHLAEFSQKAQQSIVDYIHAGGTVVFFPSIPGGAEFANLLAPLGVPQTVTGNSNISFAGGAKGMIIGSRTILPSPTSSVSTFAKDANGGVVGARFPSGKGHVIFFGGDISRWSAPPGTVLSFEEGGSTSDTKDYPEDVQRGGRATLVALMKEAGVEQKTYPDMKASGARNPGIYTTELIADAGSLPFENRVSGNKGFGFAGITNFSAEQAYSADIVVTDPRASNLNSNSGRYLRLPNVHLAPRESLLLPIRLPLDHPNLALGPGLESDELLYATAEVSRIGFKKGILHFEITAPGDGELALRLKRRPTSAILDGKSAEIRRDEKTGAFVITFSKGNAPHFLRQLDVTYNANAPSVELDDKAPWIAGTDHPLNLKATNTTNTPLAVSVDSDKAGIILPHTARSLLTHVRISQRLPNGAPLNLQIKIKENRPRGRRWVQTHTVTVHDAFEYSVSSPAGVTFPLREDQSFALVHPLLMSLNLPGEAIVRVKLKNWLDHQQTVSVATEQSDLELTPASASVKLAAGAEQTVEMHVKPTKSSGLYHLSVRLHGEGLEVVERSFIAVVAPHDSLAYAFDFDRDGFDDVILENQQVRLFISPKAGGRSFGFVLKSTNHNSFDSIGGLHDTFATRFEPDDLKGLPDWTRANWLGLYNRPYVYRISKVSGHHVEVQLAYEAPDIYPKGVKLTRTMSLDGDQNVVVADYKLTPLGIDKPQAFILENSVPFRSFDQPTYSQWFSSDQQEREFVENPKPIALPETKYFATRDKHTGETFAIMPVTPVKSLELTTGKNAASLRITYPDFDRGGKAYAYRVAFYLGNGGVDDVDKAFKSVEMSPFGQVRIDETARTTAP